MEYKLDCGEKLDYDTRTFPTMFLVSILYAALLPLSYVLAPSGDSEFVVNAQHPVLVWGF